MDDDDDEREWMIRHTLESNAERNIRKAFDDWLRNSLHVAVSVEGASASARPCPASISHHAASNDQII